VKLRASGCQFGEPDSLNTQEKDHRVRTRAIRQRLFRSHRGWKARLFEAFDRRVSKRGSGSVGNRRHVVVATSWLHPNPRKNRIRYRFPNSSSLTLRVGMESPLLEMSSDSQRFTTTPFPSYSYVPGQQPHPTSHVDGHSYGHPEPVVENFNVEHWRECSTFLFGIDLFNASFFWESHEQWEAVWNSLGRTGIQADFIKALIKLAAAKVKLREGKAQGVERHARRALELFEGVGKEFEQLCGLKLASLCEQARALAANAETQIKLDPLV